MTSRTSELDIKARYDAGHASLPWQPPASGENFLKLDIDKVLETADPKALVQSLPPQVVYHSIKHVGITRAVDLLPLLSNEQFMRLLDYDAWSQDELDPRQMFAWLIPLKKFGPLAIAKRFAELDEEYQLALLDQRVVLFEEEDVERLPDNQRDRLIAIPGNQLFYEIRTDDPELHEFFVQLIGSAFSLDVRYAISLLAHAAYNPPNEASAQLYQFRKARLEEDGFVGYLESLRVFDLIDLRMLSEKWRPKANPENAMATVVENYSFLEEVVYKAIEEGRWDEQDGFTFQEGSLVLGNSLCTATHVEPDNLDAVNRILEQAKSLMSLGLQYICRSDYSSAVECLKQEFPKTLFRAGLSVIHEYQAETIVRLKSVLTQEKYDRLQKFWLQKRWGELQWLIDTELLEQLTLPLSESLKGLFNRYPMAPEFLRSEGQAERVQFVPIRNLSGFQRLKDIIQQFFEEAGSQKAGRIRYE